MDRPDTSVVAEVTGHARVPVSRREDRGPPIDKLANVRIQDRYYRVAIRYGQRASRAEVVLHVDDNQRIVSHAPSSSCRPWHDTITLARCDELGKPRPATTAVPGSRGCTMSLRLTTDLPRTADLVVIGGGVLGAATAFYASRAGLQTVVVERRPLLCSLTTPVAAGGFRLQFDNPEETALVRESLETFENFAEVTDLPGYDLRLQKQGYLFVTTDPKTARRQAERVAMQRSWGVQDVELLDGSEARYRFPYLSEEIISARYRAGDGFVDPKRLTYGYARASNATFLVSTSVTGFYLVGGRITGVQTSRGDIATNAVVIAAGPFTGEIARLAGLDLGLTAVRRHRLVMPEVPEVPSDAPFVIDEDNGAHWRPAFQGAYLVFTDPSTPPGDPLWSVPTDPEFVFLLLDPSSDHNV